MNADNDLILDLKISISSFTEMLEKQIYIITGGPGFGKTELIEELRKSGYLCSGEFARDLIEKQMEIGGEILPWRNSALFQQEILNKRIAFFDSVPKQSFAFSDRGIPDQIAFARYKGFKTPEILIQSAVEHRYASQVFVTPPWPEIYINDHIRTETYQDAFRIHQEVIATYSGLDYQIIELPLFPVVERMAYLLRTLLKLRNNEN